MNFVGQAGRYGLWRLACAVPAMLTSAVQVVIVCALLGRYAIVGLLVWLSVGFVLLTRRAERAAVHAVYQFRDPTGTDAQWLSSLQAWAEHRCGVRPGRLDWYVRDDPQPNAFAAGRCSVAVTTGFLQLLHTGRIGHDEAVAVVIHEIGHHATGATRYGLLAEWLCWPWRVTYRTVMRLGGAMPYAEAGMMLLPVVFVIAIVQTAQLDAPPEQLVPVLALLATLAMGIFVAPVLDAVFARGSERAADRYTTQRGAGPDLAAALHQVGPCQPSGLLGRLHHTHPATSARLARLAGTAASAGQKPSAGPQPGAQVAGRWPWCRSRPTLGEEVGAGGGRRP